MKSPHTSTSPLHHYKRRSRTEEASPQQPQAYPRYDYQQQQRQQQQTQAYPRSNREVAPHSLPEDSQEDFPYAGTRLSHDNLSYSSYSSRSSRNNQQLEHSYSNQPSAYSHSQSLAHRTAVATFSFLEEEEEEEESQEEQESRIEQHQSSSTSTDKMVWKRRPQPQQATTRNKTPTRGGRQSLKQQSLEPSLLSSHRAPQHAHSPPGSAPYQAKNNISWESFGDEEAFPKNSSGALGGMDYESVSSTQTPEEQSDLFSTPTKRERGAKTPGTGTSSTVTASTTTSTTPGTDDSFLYQQQRQRQQQQQQQHLPPEHRDSRASPVLSMLTPFVSERQDPQRPAQMLSKGTPSQEEEEEEEGIFTNNDTSNDQNLISHLLQPPPPEDRSERRRLQYEKEKRRAVGGVYDGELEPEGVRGQEAPMPNQPAPGPLDHSSAPNMPALRTFDNARPPPGTPNNNPRNSSNKHVTLLLTPTSRGQQQENKSMEAALTPPSARSAGRRNIENASSVRTVRYDASTGTTQPLRQDPMLPNHKPRPILRNSPNRTANAPPPEVVEQDFSSSSTDSDEELRGMRSDLIQGVSDSKEEDNEKRTAASSKNANTSVNTSASSGDYYADQEAPSPIAAAAAATAAQSLKQSRSSNRPFHSWPQVEPARDALELDNDSESDKDDEEENSDRGVDVDEWNRLAMQDVERGRFDSAVARFTRVVECQKEQHGICHPAVASAYHNLGTVHAKCASTKPEESLAQQESQTLALQAFQAAARTARDSLSPHHPNVAVSLVRIGFLLLQSKQYDNAVITFEEALRIRKLAYGPKHPLVANLYNNLGVCQMHLHNFGAGKDSLEHALEIQRDLISGDSASAHSGMTAASKRSQSLEVADTLFNIGGLCLEWIRKRGPDLRRQQDAESVFEEAFQIRSEILGPSDPLTVQVRDLLQMTQSIPRPRPLKTNEPTDPPQTRREQHEYEMEAVTPEEVLSVSTPPTPNRRQPDGSGSKGSRGQSSQKVNARSRPTTPPYFADRVMGEIATNRQSPASSADEDDMPDRYAIPKKSGMHEMHVGRVVSPKRSSRPITPISATRKGRSGDYTSPPVTPQSHRDYQRSLSPERQRLNNVQASLRRTLSGDSGDSFDDRQGSNRASSRAFCSEEDEDNQYFGGHETSSSRSKNDHRFSDFRDFDGNQLSSMYSAGTDHKARPLQSERTRRHKTETPPINEVTVRSAGDDQVVEISTRGTRVYVQPSIVPVSPARYDSRNLSSQTVADLDDTFETSATVDGAPSLPHANPYPFDTEENCLIGDTGIDSEYGRVHIPPTWAKAGLVLNEEDPEQKQREIMVTRPSRIDSSRSPERRARSRSRSQSRGRSESKDRLPRGEFANETDSDANIDTGNEERDEIMKRARAFIRAFESSTVDAVSTREVEQPSIETDSTFSGQDSVEDSLQAEDGLADLGGDWMPSRSRHCSIEEMAHDPRSCLPEVFEEACARLKRDDVEGALPLFGVIFRCQRERYGLVHEHTASALYNLGIAHLRGQRAEEALDAFEEATRIRRGALGREHPSVAVSLVKIGITHLLLHRFEDALWNFREALSVRKRALGPLHPSTARIYNNIGCVHVEFNELREARRAFETALEVQRNALSDDPDSRGIMLATATTLCNLGYLYRHRELHGKAALVLKEAADLQETVLGRSNPAALSTLDCLADSCASSGQTSDALRYYNIIITRYRVGGTPGSQTVLRAEAVLLYKMSRVHRQRNDRESQLDTLKLALRSVRALADPGSTRKDALERRIVYDVRSCREMLEKNKMKWI